MLTKHHRSFLIRSWVDLPHVYETSRWMAFQFPSCHNCFCLLLTLSTFTFLIFLIPGTFHPKRWVPPSPCCPTSKYFPLDSDPLNLDLKKAEICLDQNALSSLHSGDFISKALPNILKNWWLTSAPLNSTE